MSLGKIITEARINKKMTREQLARKLDISLSQLYKVEKGVSVPSALVFISIAKVLKLPLDKLIKEGKL